MSEPNRRNAAVIVVASTVGLAWIAAVHGPVADAGIQFPGRDTGADVLRTDRHQLTGR